MRDTKMLADQQFDGVICIGGEDWWYHNRGHFDFQIMRRIARKYPVVFVNSLGVRMPSLTLDKAFSARIARKMKSLSRGLVCVEHKFWVFSPFTIPGQTGETLSQWALAPQIKLAALRAGIRKPLLWMHCPAGAPLVEKIDATALVLQRTDRFEAFPEGDPERLGAQIKKLKAQADLVIYSAAHLQEEERSEARNSLLVTHGVELETFISAGDKRRTPDDMASLTKPRVGFIGGIDHHTFDPELFLKVAAALPDVTFVMVGGCSLPPDWCQANNVVFLGRKPYDTIADYMAAMDVLIMPWNKSEWIKACNPIKLKEYLAVGRPVVTTDFPALDGFRDVVSVADDADAFALKIRHALMESFGLAKARERVATESWDAKTDLILSHLQGLGSFEGKAVSPDHVSQRKDIKGVA